MSIPRNSLLLRLPLRDRACSKLRVQLQSEWLMVRLPARPRHTRALSTMLPELALPCFTREATKSRKVSCESSWPVAFSSSQTFLSSPTRQISCCPPRDLLHWDLNRKRSSPTRKISVSSSSSYNSRSICIKKKEQNNSILPWEDLRKPTWRHMRLYIRQRVHWTWWRVASRIPQRRKYSGKGRGDSALVFDLLMLLRHASNIMRHTRDLEHLVNESENITFLKLPNHSFAAASVSLATWHYAPTSTSQQICLVPCVSTSP